MKPDVARAIVSWHEAGHAVAARALGGTLTGPLSIRPRRHWRGVAFTSPPAFAARAGAEVDVALPLALWPADVRRSFEVEIMVALAGGVAEQLVPFAADGKFSVETVDALERGRERAGRTRQIPVRERVLLAAGDGVEAHRFAGDYEQAHSAAAVLVGQQRVHEELQLQRGEVRRLFALPRPRRQLDALALALLEHETLSSRAAGDVIDEAAA